MILSLFVGMCGLFLTYLVLKQMDFNTQPYSSYRHINFIISAIGIGSWCYCVIGVSTANTFAVVLLGSVVIPLLWFRIKYKDCQCNSFITMYNMIKSRLALNKTR